MWCIHRMQCYSALKRKEILTCTRWMNLENIMLSDINQPQKDKYYMSPLTWGTGEGNGNPLQCSCLQNPRDGRAWWAAIYGVAQSWTQLKRLNSSSSSTSVMRLVIDYGRWGVIYLSFGCFEKRWPQWVQLFSHIWSILQASSLIDREN